KTFGWFVLVMSSVILAQEIHPAVGIAAAALTTLAAAMTVACNRYAHCPLHRLTTRLTTPKAAA
ncbi:sulfite exporter TauE/SafE family protein, partial [Mycolicibacterium sp. D5.8-2]|nr:sulfite exporter TauE/SafE family protein [Mycolicibacterium sp. D5.8-2]